MNFVKKMAVVCSLTCAVFVVNGCSEGSTSFEQKSSINVSTSSGVTYESNYTETKSENGLLVYKMNDVNFLDGKTEFHVSITNNGNRDTTLNEMTLKFRATDATGIIFQEGSTHYTNLNINLPQNQEIYTTFAIEDPDYKKFTDSFSVDFSFTNVVINPDIQ